VYKTFLLNKTLANIREIWFILFFAKMPRNFTHPVKRVGPYWGMYWIRMRINRGCKFPISAHLWAAAVTHDIAARDSIYS